MQNPNEKLSYEELYEVAEHLRVRVLQLEEKLQQAQNSSFRLADKLRAEQGLPPRYEQHYRESASVSR